MNDSNSDFEAWLDKEHKKWAELMYQAVHDESKMTEDEIKKARAQMPSLGIVPFRDAARAAWAKAQERSDRLAQTVNLAAKKLKKAHDLFTTFQDSYCAEMIDVARQELEQALQEYRSQ